MREKKYRGIIHKYRRFLPVSDKTPVITLNEGNTPLIYAGYLSKLVGKKFEVYLKYEGHRGDVRFYRKHFGICCCIRCSRRNKMHCAYPQRSNCFGKT